VGIFPAKPRKSRKKPVETALLQLTFVFESRKVNGGRFFRTRVITGFRAWGRETESAGSEHKTRSLRMAWM
jgi:hypothetical protein